MNQRANHDLDIDDTQELEHAAGPETYLVDGAGCVVGCADAGHGRHRQWLGKRLEHLLPPAIAARCRTAIEEVHAGDGPRYLRIETADGVTAAQMIEISALHGLPEQTALLRIAAAVAPTPAASTVEPELFELAQAQARMGWFEREVGAAYGRCSAAFAELLGIASAAGRYHAEAVAARIHPDDRARYEAFAQGIDAAAARRAGVSATYRIEHPLHGPRYVEARYRLIDDARSRRLFGIAIDVTEREETATELARSRARLESVMHKAHVAPFEWDLRRNELSGPPSLARLFHVDEHRNTWPTAAFMDAIHPDDRAVVQDVFDHPPGLGQASAIEYRVRAPDGSYATVEVRYALVADSDGAESLVRGVVIDVSDRMALEAQRREAERRFATLSRLVPGVLYQFHRAPDGTMAFRYTSHAVSSLLGLSRSAAESDFDNILAIVHRDDVARLQSSIEHSALTMTDWREDLRIHHPDGRVHWIMGHATPVREDDGAIVWNGYLSDITAQKEAAQALVESAAHLNLALSYAGMIPWYWDARSDELKSISAVRPEFRAADGKIYMRRFMAMVHADERAMVEQVFRDKLARPDNDEIRVAYRARRLDTSVYQWFEITARARIEGGEVLGFYGITADIDARRRAEIEQETLRAQLLQAQKMESIGLLTGGIAHDFNNVIAAILGYSGLALRRYGEAVEPKLRGYLHEVQHAGERARDMVQQLMAFGRAEAMASQPVDVATVIDDSLRMLRPMLPSTMDVEVEVAPALPAALVDPVQAQQVLVNLCINARDATGERGTVRIEAGLRQVEGARCASCHATFDGEFVVIAVADDGPGITGAELDRLFEPFYSTKTQGAGTGMGLAMTHGIVHAHDGHLLLASAPGQGARFEVLLPAAGPTALTTPAPAGVAQRAPTRVLVVDDEPGVAAFLGELLELEGYSVTTENDPRAALARFEATPLDVDAVVTDQTMPGLTGFDLARALLARRPELPIILVSGYSATIDERDALNAGLKAYLPKPIDETALLEVLARATRAGSPAGSGDAAAPDGAAPANTAV
ncbi:MAG: PAS domain-containing protein [Gammaproteobacteria bacterium]